MRRIAEAGNSPDYRLPTADFADCGVFVARLDHYHQDGSSVEITVPPETKFICIIPNNTNINAIHLSLNSAKLSSSAKNKLSSRELEVLNCVYCGKTHREISKELYISVRTVRQHIQNIKNKLGACTGAQAVGIALSLGLLEDVKSLALADIDY